MPFMVKKYYKTAVLGAAVFVCTFMSLPALAQSNDMRAVMNRLDQVDNQIQTLSKSVYRGNSIQTAAPTPSYDGSIGEGGNVAAMLNSRLGELEEDMRGLIGKVEEQNFTINQLKSQIDIMKSDTELRLNALEGGAHNVSPAAPSVIAPSVQPATTGLNTTLPSNDMTSTGYNEYTEPTPVSPTASASGNFSFDNPSTLYDQSFQAIRDQDFPRAEEGFKEFLGRYPGHKLAGNAKYWLGETYYVRGAFDDAIKAFAEGYQQYPQGNKAPDNLLKLGVTLAQKDRVTDACVALQQLKSGFPNAATAIKARADKEIKRLNCE